MFIPPRGRPFSAPSLDSAGGDPAQWQARPRTLLKSAPPWHHRGQGPAPFVSFVVIFPVLVAVAVLVLLCKSLYPHRRAATAVFERFWPHTPERKSWPSS